MKKREVIDSVLQSGSFAITGVSSNRNKFGNYIFRELTDRGIPVFPVHPVLEETGGTRCFRTLADIPETPEALIICTNPANTPGIVKEASAAGIKKIWMQQGSESAEAEAFCESRGISYVKGECIFMYSEPVKSFHRFHKGLWKIFGKYHK